MADVVEAIRFKGAEGEASTRAAAEVPADSAKRRQILDGARQVFLASGFDGASMGEIARAAGVSKGTLYVYFASKEALFEALTIEQKRAQAEALFDQLDPDDPDVRGTLRRLGLEVMAMMTRPEHVSSVRMVIGVAEKFPEFGRSYYEAGPEQGRKRLAAYFARQIEAGRLRPCDPVVAAGHCVDLCHGGTIRRILFGLPAPATEAERERLVDEALRVFFAAYGPE
jgi:AcrR family transcriptional regulator